MQFVEYAEKNKAPIWNALKSILNLEKGGRVLEIGSGTGQHAAFLLEQLGPSWSWTPSDLTAERRASVEAHAARHGVAERMRPFEVLDAAHFEDWVHDKDDADVFDVVFSANVIHIAPPAVYEGIIRGAAAALNEPEGRLVFYGPFARDGTLAPESNVRFDQEFLKAKDPSFGVRDLERELLPLAERCGMVLEDAHSMPSNNFLVVFIKKKE